MASANKKPKYPQIVTPKGEALWAHLDAPELYEGKPVGYTIMQKLSAEDTLALKAKLLEVFDHACKNHPDFLDSKGNTKPVLDEPQIGLKVNKDGEELFKFRTQHEYQNKAGETIKRTVPMFDAKKNKITVDIGNGSIIRVAFTPSPYWKSKTNNGVALYMDAIQVIKHVPRGKNTAEAFGFGEEDGFEIDDETPFPDAPVGGAPSDGDF